MPDNKRAKQEKREKIKAKAPTALAKQEGYNS
jgi:hypothetical protein